MSFEISEIVSDLVSLYLLNINFYYSLKKNIFEKKVLDVFPTRRESDLKKRIDALKNLLDMIIIERA